MNVPRYAIALGLIGLASVVHAASFDCARAATAVEKMICADAILSQGDEDLAEAYAQALAQTPRAASVRAAQRAWVTQVRDRCVVLACLRRSYAQRLDALQTAGSTGPTTADPYGAPCRQLAQQLTLGLLDELLVKPAGKLPPSMLREMAEDLGNEEADYWDIDLDGDSIPDRLAIVEQGTMRAATAYVKPGKAGSAIVKHDVMENDGIDLRVVKIARHPYLLASGYLTQSPLALWRLGSPEGFTQMCRVNPLPKPVIKLTTGWRRPVCEAAAADRLEPVEFDLERTLAPLPAEHRFWSLYERPGHVSVDIDNDGVAEHVFNVQFDSNAGRGCSAARLVVADAKGQAVPDTWLNRQLLSDLGFACESLIEITRHKGVTYVDAKNAAGDRTLYRIASRSVSPVCEFRAVPRYGAVGGVVQTWPKSSGSSSILASASCPVAGAWPSGR